jgi:GAF domain-containing protein
MMDTRREAAFDNIVFTAAQLFRVPIAMLAVVGRDRVWVKAGVGPLPRESSVEDTFCGTAIQDDEIVIVEDASTDKRFAGLPIVAGPPNVRFYAGVPVHGPGNLPVAILCVLDRHPRTVPDRARQQLLQLAREAESLLQHRIPETSPGG